MTPAISQRSMENRQYVRRLLKEKQPGFSAALELALVLAELKLWLPQTPPGQRRQRSWPVIPRR
jgi:hypothetical protein